MYSYKYDDEPLKMIIIQSAVFKISELCSFTLTQTKLDACPVLTATFEHNLAILRSTTAQYDKARQITSHTT